MDNPNISNKLNLEEVYKIRFGANIDFRKKMWKILCEDFFQKYIPKDAVILEIGAGYCEFINNIKGKRKIALDLNPDIQKFAADNVDIILSDSTDMPQIKDSICDAVFASNFFEHLTKEDIVKTIKEINRVLKTGGRFLLLQPNIRFCYKDYWNFFDHITPLDDRSLSEILKIYGFEIVESKPKFVPFSMKSRYPKIPFMVKLYLKMPFLHFIFGKQVFIYARKI